MDELNIGRSGLRVSPLGLGTLEWGHRVDAATATAMLGRFIGAGGNLVELPSPVSPAAAVLGGALSTGVNRDDVVIAARTGVRLSGGTPVSDGSRTTLGRQLDATLAALGTADLDLWILDVWDPAVPISETLEALESARASGRVGYVGVANVTGWQLATLASQAPALAATVTEHSLLFRAAEAEVLPAAEYHGVGVIAGAALGRGVLTGKYASGVPGDSRGSVSALAPYVGERLDDEATRVVQGLRKAAHGLSVSPIDVALAWSRAQPGVSARLVAPRTLDQLDEILDAENADIPAEILEVMSEISAS